MKLFFSHKRKGDTINMIMDDTIPIILFVGIIVLILAVFFYEIKKSQLSLRES
jgi:hypothetical protein